MSKTLELGREVLRYSQTKLQLGLVASVTILSQQHSIDLSTLSSEAVFELLNSKTAWVCRGNDLSVCFEITVNGQPLQEEGTKKLTEIISNANLWKQLHLRTSLLAVQYNDESVCNSGKIQLKVSHVRVEPGSEKQQIHRLFAGVPYADIKAPEGVSVLTLQHIHLALDIGRLMTRRKKTTRCLKNRTALRAYEASEEDLFCESQSLFNPELNTMSTTLFENDICAKKPYNLSPSSTIVSRSSHDSKTLACTVICLPRKRSIAATEEENLVEQPDTISIQHIAELVDTAFRTTICKSPLKVHPDIRLSKASFFGRLADLSPALWSPGYLPALSQRACFLPVISRSLSHSIYHKSRSASLKAKLEKLCDRRYTTLPDTGRAESEYAESMDRSIHSRLWSTVQNVIFDQSAARNLKPLTQREQYFDPIPDSDEMMGEVPDERGEICFKSWLVAEDLPDMHSYHVDSSMDELLMTSANDAWCPSPEILLVEDQESEVDLWDDVHLFQGTTWDTGTHEGLQIDDDLGTTCCDISSWPR